MSLLKHSQHGAFELILPPVHAHTGLNFVRGEPRGILEYLMNPNRLALPNIRLDEYIKVMFKIPKLTSCHISCSRILTILRVCTIYCLFYIQGKLLLLDVVFLQPFFLLLFYNPTFVHNKGTSRANFKETISPHLYIHFQIVSGSYITVAADSTNLICPIHNWQIVYL